jgi:hypothetical protein
MKSPKKSAIQQLADEAARKAFNGVAARQTISEQENTPEFRTNLERLRAERLARESKAQPK